MVHISVVFLYIYFLLHKLWAWCQIPWIYRSVLLISGSFECRKVFLSPIWAASWRSTARSDTGKKSTAFHCSQKWFSKVGCQEKTIRTWASGLGDLTNDQSKIGRLAVPNNCQVRGRWASSRCLKRRRLSWTRGWRPWPTLLHLPWRRLGDIASV